MSGYVRVCSYTHIDSFVLRPSITNVFTLKSTPATTEYITMMTHSWTYLPMVAETSGSKVSFVNLSSKLGEIRV